ncbi:MAG: class C sortase [Clostridiales bacterium]|nr:class C sortase [Clostridiales bacterium]
MRKTSLVLAALLAVAGVCVMLWPTFTGSRLESHAEEAAQTFLEERKPEQQYPELLADLQAYNQRIYAEKQSGLVDLEACEVPAADLTAYGVEDEIIGVLEIPAMELTMPVYLGASDAHLAAGAAVLGNTSAPIGGDNTNCVIAGHRGWRGADYFRHIDRLAVGDTVKLTNLWETLTYTVADIQIIQPHEVDKIKIQSDRDLLTLLTCHPYAGGGRERYVVYCVRNCPNMRIGAYIRHRVNS